MNIYVGNLSYGMTSDNLRHLFEEFGDVVSANIIMDRDTNRSKGFGFVELATKEAGENALKELEGAKIDGREIQINEARPQGDRPKGPRN